MKGGMVKARDLVAIGVACWTITDPGQRALCRASQGATTGSCATVTDQATRVECRVRAGAAPSSCDVITTAWGRQQCRDQAKDRKP